VRSTYLLYLVADFLLLSRSARRVNEFIKSASMRRASAVINSFNINNSAINVTRALRACDSMDMPAVISRYFGMLLIKALRPTSNTRAFTAHRAWANVSFRKAVVHALQFPDFHYPRLPLFLTRTWNTVFTSGCVPRTRRRSEIDRVSMPGNLDRLGDKEAE
jgi:hypothetical protein